MNFSITEILAIVAIGVVLFGGKLPDVARNLGATLKEFKHGMRDANNDDQPETDQPAETDETEQPQDPTSR